MRHHRKRQKVHIVLPQNPPIPGSDSRVSFPSEVQSAEVCIRVPLHLSGHGIGGGGGEGWRGGGICFVTLSPP